MIALDYTRTRKEKMGRINRWLLKIYRGIPKTPFFV